MRTNIESYQKGDVLMAKITIDAGRCKGCGLCIDACPKKILKASDKINAKGYHAVECAEPEKCIGCASCYMMCPDCVITVER